MNNRRSIRYAELRSSVSVEKSTQSDPLQLSASVGSSLSNSSTLLLRYEMLEGRRHLVVPAVMLVGDSVIWPANAPSKEYVPMDCLERSHLVAFNGRPIVPRHPQRDGEFVSANDPEMFTSERTGVVFFTRLNGKNLGCEMWFDVDKSLSLGGDADLAIKKLESGETINISTGVYFEAEEVEREINGETVGAVWIEIWPDHLATLPNTDGACDLSMGCGTPRVAAGKETEEGSIEQNNDTSKDDNVNNSKELYMDNSQKKNEQKDNRSLLSRLLETFSQPFRASLVFDDGDSDEDLRSMIRKAMREIDKSFDCILPVYPENQAFIYMTYTIAGGDYSGTIKYFRRTYELASDGKSVTINDDAVEVKMKEVWETVSGEETEETDEEIIVSEKNNKKDGTCSCGNRQNQQQELNQNVDSEPVAAVSSSPVITEEMALEALPGLKAIVTEYRTMQASRRDALVTQLLSVQTVYDEKALWEKDLKQLEEIAALIGQKVTTPDPVDYSLRGNSLPEQKDKDKDKTLSNQMRKLPDPWGLNKESNKAN